MKRREVADQTRTLYRSARYASVGIEIGVSIVIGLGIGWWIDVKLGCGPWGLMIGFCLGMAAAVRAMMRTYKMIMKDHAVDENEKVEEQDDGHSQ